MNSYFLLRNFLQHIIIETHSSHNDRTQVEIILNTEKQKLKSALKTVIRSKLVCWCRIFILWWSSPLTLVLSSVWSLEFSAGRRRPCWKINTSHCFCTAAEILGFFFFLSVLISALTLLKVSLCGAQMTWDNVKGSVIGSEWQSRRYSERRVKLCHLLV